MEKQYDKYAAQIQAIIEDYERTVKDSANAATELMADKRFSAIGKEEGKKEIFGELDRIADNKTALIREIVKDFCKEYKIKLPDDGKSHDTEISNALKVIDMLGFKMTADALRTILDPFRNSYKHLKMIYDIMDAKNGGDNINPVACYDPAVMEALREYIGVNTQVIEYLNLFRQIEDIITEGVKLGFEASSVSNSHVVYLYAKIPYSILACGAWMQQAGKMYVILKTLNNKLFRAYIPTEEEIIESIATK